VGDFAYIGGKATGAHVTRDRGRVAGNFAGVGGTGEATTPTHFMALQAQGNNWGGAKKGGGCVPIVVSRKK